MIELFEKDLHTNKWQSSKGNQLKWETNGFWYKADYLGYEGLAEYIISHLLRKSSLKMREYVLYEPVEIRYKETVMKGSKSRNFLSGTWQVITLERLYESRYHRSLYKSLFSIPDHEKRLLFLISQITQLTGLKDFAQYITKLLTIDALFLNEDRHMHNIAVLMNGHGEFDYCPLFDFGASLLSDTRLDYPLGGDIYKYIGSSKSKTISFDFKEQLELAETLTGQMLWFDYTSKDIRNLLDQASIYNEQIRERVLRILLEQKRVYQYLFR